MLHVLFLLAVAVVVWFGSGLVGKLFMELHDWVKVLRRDRGGFVIRHNGFWSGVDSSDRHVLPIMAGLLSFFCGLWAFLHMLYEFGKQLRGKPI